MVSVPSRGAYNSPYTFIVLFLKYCQKYTRSVSLGLLSDFGGRWSVKRPIKGSRLHVVLTITKHMSAML